MDVLDLRLLNSFVMVAKLLHFGRAAEALHSTQPGVTQHIARLESHLGVTLLHRNKRSVALTEAGRSLLQHASQILALSDRMLDEAQAVAKGLGGQVAIGLSSAIVYSAIPQKIAEFKRTHPHVDIKTVVDSGDRIQEMLAASLIDAAITTLPNSDRAWRRSEIAIRIPMGVAMPKTHPKAARRRISLHHLHAYPFLVVPRERDPEVFDGLICALRRKGQTAQIASYEVSFPNLLARVAMDEGLALVPLAYAPMVADWGRVVPVTDAEVASLNTYLVMKDSNVSAVAAQFARALMRG